MSNFSTSLSNEIAMRQARLELLQKEVKRLKSEVRKLSTLLNEMRDAEGENNNEHCNEVRF